MEALINANAKKCEKDVTIQELRRELDESHDLLYRLDNTKKEQQATISTLTAECTEYKDR